MLRLKNHFRENKGLVIKIGVATTIMLLSPSIALGSTLDDRGMSIYWKVVSVGKYVILGKGAIECIQSALNGDFDRAKSSAIGYLLCFGLMLALPSGLNEIEGLFKE